MQEGRLLTQLSDFPEVKAVGKIAQKLKKSNTFMWRFDLQELDMMA